MNHSILNNLLRDNPIVVTGMGCFSAAGGSVAALWEAAVAGRSTAAWREFEMGTECSRFAVCSAPEPDVSQPELHPVRKMDRGAQMAWLAANQAWKQAQLTGVYPPAQIGMATGSSRGPLGKISESYSSLGRPKYPPSLSANCAFGSLGGVLAQAFNEGAGRNHFRHLRVGGLCHRLCGGTDPSGQGGRDAGRRRRSPAATGYSGPIAIRRRAWVS